MSLVLAYKRGDTVYFGSDSIVVSDPLYRTTPESEEGKLLVLPNGIIVGSVGLAVLKNYVRPLLASVRISEDKPLTRARIQKEVFNPALINITDLGVDGERHSPSEFESRMVIAYKDRCFLVSTNFSIYEIEDHVVIGGPAVLADLKIPTIEKAENIEEAMLSIFRDVRRSYNGIAAPYLTTNTKTLELEVHEE